MSTAAWRWIDTGSGPGALQRVASDGESPKPPPGLEGGGSRGMKRGPLAGAQHPPETADGKIR